VTQIKHNERDSCGQAKIQWNFPHTEKLELVYFLLEQNFLVIGSFEKLIEDV